LKFFYPDITKFHTEKLNSERLTSSVAICLQLAWAYWSR